MQNLKKAFTLIELIVSITILSIIMLSVFTIFFLASDLSNKTDVSRMLQENIKNVVETIAEDVRKNGINICDLWNNCHKFDTSSLFVESDDLYVWANHYYLAKYDKTVSDYIKVQKQSDCSSLADNCVIIRQNSFAKDRLCNSWVQFSSFKFFISKDYIPKVSVDFTILPASSKWIKSNLIKENKIVFQTTLWERFYMWDK